MYTVLLADDEPSVTEALKNKIPWTSLGVSSILTATNGRQAYDIMLKVHVDLLITDIRMPYMDGLELLTEIRKIHPDIHCILLTAFSEFDYAMRALRLGVDNFLMKPMQLRELTETVENALENIYVKRDNKETLFRENILRRWISGNISSDELSEKTILIDINIYLPNYCTVILKKKKSGISLTAYCKECIRCFNDTTLEISSVWDNEGHYILLFGGTSIDRNSIARTMELVANSFHISESVDIVFGSIVHDNSEIHTSYENACSILNNTSSNKNSCIQLYPDGEQSAVKRISALTNDSLSPIIKHLLDYIDVHYSQGISLGEFCSQFDVSTAYIGYLFKKETGIFFNTYLIDYRMEKAMDMLIHSHEKIGDIAEKTGYATTSHFISLFKKKTGLSPAKYREVHELQTERDKLHFSDNSDFNEIRKGDSYE